MKKKRKKYILSEEAKAKKKIYNAEYRLKNKAQNKIYKAKWYQDNKEDQIRQVKEWQKANPGYLKELNHKHDLGYWVVYLIHNFDGLGNIYCGQTANIYKRMSDHKSKGRLNTETHELIKQCETLEDALAFEAYMHEQGYHGSARTESGK